MNRRVWLSIPVLALGLGALVLTSCGKKSETPAVVDESRPHDYYTCPMHPEVHVHEPGQQCPICGMDLTKVEAEEAAPKAKKDRKLLFYRHPMNPSITSPTPAKDDMGMDFIPVYEDVEEGEEAGKDVRELGRGAITLSPRKRQLIGVRTAEVRRGSLEKQIRAYGRVAYDPELYHAQEEYLSALEIAELSRDLSQDASRRRGKRLIDSAETRLRILGLNDSQIRRLKRDRRVDQTLLLGAVGGGKMWVYADVYESDLAFVREGQRVQVEVPAYPGRAFSGRVLAIDPLINPKTRAARLRSEVEDPEGLLKPEMYVTAVIRAKPDSRLLVPREAVLDSGARQHVFVDEGEGRLEPRKVRLGLKGETHYEVLEGLEEGEKVVTSGNFLIDSESQLKAAMSGMTFYGGKEAGAE